MLLCSDVKQIQVISLNPCSCGYTSPGGGFVVFFPPTSFYYKEKKKEKSK